MENKDNLKNFNEFEKGIQIILIAFQQQKKNYLNIIKAMQNKITILEEELKKIKDINIIYKNKLNSIKKNIKHISTTICQLKEEEINDTIFDNLNLINNISDENKENKINTKIKEKNHERQKRHSFNKYELKKLLYKNDDLNQIFTEKRDNLNEDLKIKRNIKNNLLKNLYGKTIKYKKNSTISITNGTKKNNVINKICFDNKSERLNNKKNLYDIDGNYL